MTDRSLLTRLIHESKSVRTGIELLVVFLGLAVIYPVLALVFGWPSLLAPAGPWPILLGGLIIIVAHIGYGLYVATPHADQQEDRER